jgi:hypothetical protein
VSYNHSPLFPPSAIIGLLTFKHLFFDFKCPNHFLVSILFPTDFFYFFFVSTVARKNRFTTFLYMLLLYVCAYRYALCRADCRRISRRHLLRRRPELHWYVYKF